MSIQPAEVLKYKPDWPEARQRHQAFWEREIVDRVCLAIRAPQDEQVPMPVAETYEAAVTDIDYHLSVQRALLNNTYYGGDALPGMDSQVGWLAFGGEPIFIEEHESHIGATVWIQPTILEWDETPYRFDPQNKWCQRYFQLYERIIEDCQGEYLVAAPGLLPPTETLACLRGAESLCIDLVDHPDEVRATQLAIREAYKWVYERYFDIIDAEHRGSAAWGIWAPGRHSYITCDFSANIGPRHFREFITPELEDLSSYHDYSLFHVDGPECIRHVPALLEVDTLPCLQFTPGAAARATVGTLAFLDLYKQIQQAGKCAVILATYEEVEPLLQELDPRGIFIHTSAPSVEAADTLARDAIRWSCRGVFPAASVPPSEAL